MSIFSSGKLEVSEIFGPTIQGEGSAAGRHCLFVRLAQCNLECTWCDTAYTWAFTDEKAAKTESGIKYDKAEQIHPMSTAQVLEELNKLWSIYLQPTMVVISGGEPMMQAKKLEDLVVKLSRLGHAVHIETAGTILPTMVLHNSVAQYNVSPKLAHSGNRATKRYRPDVLGWFANKENAWFKFVIQEPSDFEEINFIVKDCNIPIQRVMVMPEGITIDENIDSARKIVSDAISRGYGLSMRSHILLWKDVRGK